MASRPWWMSSRWREGGSTLPHQRRKQLGDSHQAEEAGKSSHCFPVIPIWFLGTRQTWEKRLRSSWCEKSRGKKQLASVHQRMNLQNKNPAICFFSLLSFGTFSPKQSPDASRTALSSTWEMVGFKHCLAHLQGRIQRLLSVAFSPVITHRAFSPH